MGLRPILPRQAEDAAEGIVDKVFIDLKTEFNSSLTRYYGHRGVAARFGGLRSAMVA